MILTKTAATAVVLWHDKKKLNAILLMVLVTMLVAIVIARVGLADQMRIAEAQEMRLSLEKQEAIRASMLAHEQAKQKEASDAHRADCEAVARVLYGTALHHSEDAQKAVVWCIINRVESSLYPDTIQEVCSQESQWMGFSPENPIVSGLYEIADDVLTYWETGGYRPMSPDYLFLTWTRDEIVLKTTFTDGKNTHYWRVS